MLALIALSLLACSEPESTEPAAAGGPDAPEAAGSPEKPPEAQPQAGGPPPEPKAPTGLPDLLQGLVEDQCENGPGAEGADSYFWGTWTLSGDTMKGEERWVLFANSKWEAKGGKDCSIRWSLEGTKGAAPATCPDCAYSVSFKATPNMSTSDCPDEMMNGRRAPTGEMVGGEATPFEQNYGVRVQGDKATVVFAKSGKKLGEGYANEGGLVWLSDHSCRWF